MGMRRLLGLIVGFAASANCSAAASLSPARPSAEESVAELQIDFAAGLRSEQLTRRYLARISRLNPRLHAVITINPQAIEEARLSDSRRRQGTVRGPLDGIPILIKDNIDVAGGMPTTAGSLALRENVPQRDAWLVAQLRRAGLVILGKANLSEWANIRSSHSISGWSAVGGLARNPYALDRSACGSSSGSAVAVAANLAPLAIGTETDGSITCPAAMNGIVGIKPTVGLVSRSGIVPISFSQDTAGPLARNVADAALLLQVMSGSDPADPATAAADSHRLAYREQLAPDALQGVHIGVLRQKGFSPATLSVFEQSLQTLKAEGAVLVDVAAFDYGDLGAEELTILLTEFKAGLNAYLLRSPPAVKARSLEALIDFDRSEPRELEWFGQELFERAETTALDQSAYIAAHRDAPQRAGRDGLDRLLHDYDVAALVSPTSGPAYVIDSVNGGGGGSSAGKLSAVAGYPHVTVPMGHVAGLPVGLSFLGPAWSEAELLSFAAAFEAASHARRPPQLLPHVRPAR